MAGRGARKSGTGAATVMSAIALALLCVLCSFAVPGWSPRDVNAGQPGTYAASTAPVPDKVTLKGRVPEPGANIGENGGDQAQAAAFVAPAAPAPKAPVAVAPKPSVPPEETDPAGEGQEAPPRISAVDPAIPAPAGFTAQFYYSGNRRVALSWQPVSHPMLLGYVMLRWSGADFSPMLSIFRQLATMDPSLVDEVEGFSSYVSQLNQPGLTYSERNAILEQVEACVDPIYYAVVRTPGAEGLVEQLVDLADIYWTISTSYSDTGFSDNTYYLYIAATVVWTGDTSPASNCEGVFTVRLDGRTPAAPTGFTATAYDPGVALEWSRNTEADLAGYDVYRRQGNRWVKLNPTLIDDATEYFYMTGIAGERYGIRAVDLEGRESNIATATAVLAPATVYDADSPAWLYPAGTWARENYTQLEAGGRVLRVGSGAGSRATLTFNGRRIRVYSARYWSCGTVNYYIDGKPAGSFDLYYDGGYTPEEGSPRIPALWQQMTFQVTGLSKGQHTLVIEASGIPGAGGYDFVNFDYAEAR